MFEKVVRLLGCFEIDSTCKVPVRGHRAGQCKSGDGHSPAGAKPCFIGMRSSCRRNVLRGIRCLRLDLRLPVWISDLPVLRKLSRPLPGDRLEERAAGPLHAYKKVCAVKPFVEHAALVLGEVIVMPANQNAVALQQTPGHERHLLRIEVRGGILVREMDAVVARSVVPSAMYIDHSRLPIRKWKMTVGFIDKACGALRFEVEDDV